tara:strand:- start:963 stop:3080 length:2118 start_codon:yes stop_codon:yes gene_type:complete
MTLQLLKYQAGIVKDITEYSAGKNGPFWVDGNLIRFKNGYPEKIGGWQKDTINALDSAGTITSTEASLQGIARKMVYWRSITDGEDRIAVGTHNHLYIVENNALYDITPLRDSTNAATTTTEALDNSETEIDLSSVSGFKTAGSVIIGSEIISYTGISSLTLTGGTRGASSTTAAAHDSGAAATQVLIGPIATTDESTVITITDSGHGASIGDFVVFTGAAATGGVTAENLNRKAGYQIVTVPSVNSYTIASPTEATSTVSAGGGNAVVINYLIGTSDGLGYQSATPALGWGAGGWGESTWGTPRAVSEADISLDNSSWDLDLWGEDLIATVRGDDVYYWDTSAGNTARASLVSEESGATSVPTNVRISTVSFPDRHFIAAGCTDYSSGNFDPMLIRWSNQEDFTVFAPTATNTAGDQRLQVGTKIITMVSSREETIISTDEAIYGMTFIGAPFIFSFRLLATNAGASGINTMINVDGRVYWMGRNNFFSYDGVVKEIQCSVQYYVFNRIQKDYIDKTIVGHNKKFKEVTWFYVSNANSAGTLNPEPDSYVTLNYAENAWTIGSMDRTAWLDSFGFRKVPFAFDSSGYLYDQETGTSANGSAMSAYIETSPREITENGENLYLVDKIIPDVTMSSDTNLYVDLNTRKYPHSTEVTKGPFTVTSSTQKISTRARGRQIALKFYSTGTADEWSMGTFRINAKVDSLR